MGTFVEIEVDGEPGHALEAAIDAAFDAIASVHRLMSFHERDSDVGRLNCAAPGCVVAIHPWTGQVLEAALELNWRSGGAFDIAVGTALQRLGLLPGVAAAPRHAAGAARISCLEMLSDRAVRVCRPGLRIDLGGIAKGYAVDRAVDRLIACGVASGLVNAGGDLRVFGAKARRVHIRDPRHPSSMLCAVDVVDQAIASSAIADERFGFDAAGTVIDPWRQAPASTMGGASVRASSCMMADALTKVVMICGEAADPLLKHHQASAVFVSAAGEVVSTPDWEANCHASA
jgi:thiamine biosynthesis lipoprotein